MEEDRPYTGYTGFMLRDGLFELTHATSRRKGAFCAFCWFYLCVRLILTAKGPGETFAEVATPSELFTWFVTES